jgi:phage-related protein
MTVERPLAWIGSSRKDLLQLPAAVRRFFGFALRFAQSGEQHPAAKALKGFGDAVFVLHCFQKKSKSGIATPKEDMDVVRTRLKAAEALAKEMKNANAGH